MLDLRLPKVDGLEVLRKLDVLQSCELGVNRLISKLVQFEKFSQMVAQLGMYCFIVNRPPVVAAL